VKRIAFCLVASAATPVIGTKVTGQAIPVPRVTRRKSATHWIVSLALPTAFFYLSLVLFFCPPAQAQSQPVDQLAREFNLPDAPEPTLNAAAETQQRRTNGTVSGTVVDQTGKGVAGANVTLTRDQDSVTQEVQSDGDGHFAFGSVAPGLLQVAIVADGFTGQMLSFTLRPSENHLIPPITLSLATQVTEIRVSPSAKEIAQEQLKDQEKQRVFGIVPNFYVSYVDEAAPLTSTQKFQLALRTATDPVSIAAVSMIAGVNQATDRFSGYGQGAEGYAKRYGASYANFASGLFIGGAVLPSLLKQDPRYFYKGSGTTRSRLLYALSRVVICKGDNQKWQPNYSSILGDLAAGGISNLYIPERDRHGAALTFENAGISLATSAAIGVLQEFVLHKVTSHRQSVVSQRYVNRINWLSETR
jgi:hypothetical protein